MTELLSLAAAHPGTHLALLLVGAAVIRQWISHRTAIRREVEATRRWEAAVRDTASRERAAIVRAFHGR